MPEKKIKANLEEKINRILHEHNIREAEVNAIIEETIGPSETEIRKKFEENIEKVKAKLPDMKGS